MSEVILLPCPFCGGDARINHDNKYYTVCCEWAGCEQGVLGFSEHAAIEKWNTRTDSELRRKADMADELAGVLQRYKGAYPAFRLKRIGSENSEARREQEMLTSLEETATATLEKWKGQS